MQNEKREIKELASDLFILLGSDSCRYLINLIVTTEDLSVRREVFTTLVRLGDIARPYIEEEVRNFKHTWFALRNLIKILGELGNGESVRSFASHFSHKNSKVREECLNSAARLLQGESETFIFPLLKDEDSGIRRKAVSILSSFQSENTALFNLINDKLRKRLKSEETEEDTDFQIVCAKALLEYESVWKKVSSKFEETLLSALKHESGIKGVFGLTKYREKPVELKMAIIDAVGAIGTRNCLEDLEKLSDHPDLNIRIKSRESAEKIKKRTITSR
jgi:HEAT repeat protein